MTLQDPARLIWSLTESMLGTTLNAAGNSGGFSAANPNACTPVDLRAVDDLMVTVAATGSVTGTTPTLNVQLDLYDDLGNLIPQVGKLGTALTAAVLNGFFCVGRHNATQVVLPQWGRISWTVGGTASPTFPGVEIAVFGR